jgi:CBS domain-containing protein
MKASEIMTSDPTCVTPEDPARRAAQLMSDWDCGCLPVIEGRDNRRVVGVVTDRDLAVRGFAQGKGADTPVRELMTADLCCCSPDDDVQEVERAMTDWQLRRIVIADGDGCCVGIISQADLARAAERRGGVYEHDVARVVESISAPSPA